MGLFEEHIRLVPTTRINVCEKYVVYSPDWNPFKKSMIENGSVNNVTVVKYVPCYSRYRYAIAVKKVNCLHEKKLYVKKLYVVLPTFTVFCKQGPLQIP